MQVAYKFKLRPNQKQTEMLESWQHMVGYVQNRSLGDRTMTYNKTFVEGAYCDLYTKREINGDFIYCDLATNTVISPLHCCVNKSASLGYPWKENVPSRRRAKPRYDGALKPFYPKRSAYEMHSNWVTNLKKVDTKYQAVNADVLQQSLRHIDSAFNKFFSGKAGYPNFKKHRDVTFEYKPKTVRISNSYMTFPGLGTMRFFKSREIPESWEVRTVTVSCEIDRWYTSVVFKDDTIPTIRDKQFQDCKTIQGADVGINKLVALSDGTMIANPRFLKKAQRRLAIRQRRVSRKKKGSNKCKKAVQNLSRTHQKIRRQRTDYQWKAAIKIAQNADITVFEDLNVKNMKARCKPKLDPSNGKYLNNGQRAKAGLNQAISDASWHSLRLKTKHQASKLGNKVIEVNPRHTSQECPVCHHVSPKNRNKEKFICEECSHSDDADTNGAVNQAVRGKTKLGIDSLLVVSQKVTRFGACRKAEYIRYVGI